MPELPTSRSTAKRSMREYATGPRADSDHQSIPASHASRYREVEGKRVLEVSRLGKRIVLAFEDDLFLVLPSHDCGRLRWLEGNAKAPARITLATFSSTAGRSPSPKPAPSAAHRFTAFGVAPRSPNSTWAAWTFSARTLPHLRSGCS